MQKVKHEDLKLPLDVICKHGRAPRRAVQLLIDTLALLSILCANILRRCVRYDPLSIVTKVQPTLWLAVASILHCVCRRDHISLNLTKYSKELRCHSDSQLHWRATPDLCLTYACLENVELDIILLPFIFPVAVASYP
jgi:hypothetical protein